MKKVNFNALQKFDVPESWLENAINAKPKPPKRIFQFFPRYMITAASLVLAAGMTFNVSSILDQLFAPLESTKIEETIVYSLSFLPNSAENVTKSVADYVTASETAKNAKATEASQTTKETSEQQITVNPAEIQDGTQISEDNNRSEDREEAEQSDPSNKSEPQNADGLSEEQNDSEEEKGPTSNVESDPNSTTEERVLPIVWPQPIIVSPGYVYYGSSFSSTEEVTAPTDLENYFTNSIVVKITEEFADENYTIIHRNISNHDAEIGRIVYNMFQFEMEGYDTIAVSSSPSAYVPCGAYDFEFLGYKNQEYTPIVKTRINLAKEDIVFTLGQ